jgi:hypothetical protein
MRWGGEESRCRREVWVIGDGVHITTTKGGWLAFTSWVAFWFGLEFGLPDWFGTAWGQHFLTYYYDTPHWRTERAGLFMLTGRAYMPIDSAALPFGCKKRYLDMFLFHAKSSLLVIAALHCLYHCDSSLPRRYQKTI